MSKRNSASLENHYQPNIPTYNNAISSQQSQYDNGQNKAADNGQKSKIAEMYLNAVEKNTSNVPRNASSVQQARANVNMNTNLKYNQTVPQDAETAAKAARVTGGNSKRSAGSYSAASSAKQLKAGSISEPPSKTIRTSPVPERKSYRDKSGKKHQEIKRYLQCIDIFLS